MGTLGGPMSAPGVHPDDPASLPGDHPRPGEGAPLELAGRSLDPDAGILTFTYRLGGDSFTETFTLTEPFRPLIDPEHPGIDHLLDIAHLCVGVSYYKLTLPGRIVSPRPLHPQTVALAPHLYDHGLRELAVRNGLNVPLPIEVELATSPSWATPSSTEELAIPFSARSTRPGGDNGAANRFGSGPLVPFGGGKDSTLTLHALTDHHPVAFSIHPTPVQRRVTATMGVPLLEMTRQLDPLLATRTAEGGWNGHIPITSINSSVSAIIAALSGRRDVVIANERSADEPTQRIDGVPVNHQYSKTFAFETALAAALAPTGIRYWSSVRRFSELAISGALAQHRKLRNTILSCNRAFSVTRPDPDPHWCLDCAKCRFTFVSFAPFLDVDEAVEMFGGNLLDDPTQVDGVRALWADKPFDCVGELAESAIAVAHLATRPGWRDTAVVRALADEAGVVAADSGTDLATLLAPRGADNVPEDFDRALNRELRAAQRAVGDRATP